MRGARRQIAMVQVIGLDPALDEGAHQRAEHLRRIVDAGKQHRLARAARVPASASRAQAARACGVNSRG